ncbi:helix-turn-helix domain-containing protein [Aeoliella sp.]|uniref:helix-turn-helix domain-containing protein n=1 Tax=Aeoliella sp. TaxID=2795800 RepID=UPI003CCBFB74
MSVNYFTVAQLAERMQVKPQTILSWIHNGELRAIDVSSRPGCGRPRWRIPADALLDFEAKRLGFQEPKPRRRRKSPTVTEYF